MATFASKTKSHDDKGRGRPGDCLLRREQEWIFYDENGNETESVVLNANGEYRMLSAERDRWHSLECLESGTVIFECKDGAYHPLEADEVMEG